MEAILFVVILIFYLLTLLGNTAIILVSCLDSTLHTPVYFFLTNLSFLDLCLATSIIPQLLWNLKGPAKTITSTGCAIQLYVSLSLGSTECVLLTIMAFDRQVAVCRPLNYTSVVHPSFCKSLAGIAWLYGVGSTLIQGTITLRLPRCGHHRVHNFLCEVPAVINLACADIHTNEVQPFVAALVLLLLPVALILVSYGFIVQAVSKIKSFQAWPQGSRDVRFPSVVVSLFFGTSSAIYIQPKRFYGHSQREFLTLFYTVVTPTLTPLIYTLRNKDVKGALRRMLRIEQNS